MTCVTHSRSCLSSCPFVFPSDPLCTEPTWVWTRSGLRLVACILTSCTHRPFTSACGLRPTSQLRTPGSRCGVSLPGSSRAVGPCLPAPNRYAGDPHECRGYLNQCKMQFELSPSRFPTARSRVAYIMSLLNGKALAWASPIWEREPAMTRDYSRFLREFRQVFDTPGRQITADSSLFHISQGTRPVAEYALDFWTIAAETSWNDDSLSAAFWQGLSDAIKDQLVTMERPTRLKDLIAVCILVEQRLRERRLERALPRTTSSWSTCRSLVHYGPQPMDEPEYMQLGSHRLSVSERQCRREGALCHHCGHPGHLLVSCPLRPGNAGTQ
ncbi:hypothetical protein FKM82_020926 [Ascaphus truei]